MSEAVFVWIGAWRAGVGFSGAVCLRAAHGLPCVSPPGRGGVWGENTGAGQNIPALGRSDATAAAARRL